MALEFKSTLDDSRFTAALRRMDRGADTAATAISRSFSGVGATLAGAFSIGAVTNFSRAVIDMAGDLADTSAALGITTDRLQGLQAFFAQSGTNAEQFRNGMTKAAESLDEIRTKDGPARAALEKLGLTFEDVADSELDEFMLQVAEGFSKASDRGAALAAVIDLIGKNGKKIASGMNDGRAAIEEFSKSAAKLSDRDTKFLDALGDSAMEAGRKLKVALGGAAAGMLRKLFSPYGVHEPEAIGPMLGPENQTERSDPRQVTGEAAAMKEMLHLTDEFGKAGVKAYQDFDKAREEFDRNFVADGKKSAQRERDQAELVRKHSEIWRNKKREQLEMLKDGITTTRDNSAGLLGNAQAEMSNFNRQSGDERRQANRDFLDERRAQNREKRMKESGATDARSGAGRRLKAIDEAQQMVALSEKSINALVAEIAKLVVAP